MKTPRRLFSALGLGLLVVLPLRASPELVGLLSIPGATRFRLVDREAGTSAWLMLQQVFGAYTLASYDPKTDVLVLTKDGTRIELRLGPAKVAPTTARLSVKGTVQLGGGETVAIERATLVLGEDNAIPLNNGIVLHLTPSSRPDGSLVIAAGFVRTPPNGPSQTLQAMSVVALPGQAFSVQIGSSRNPADQLGFSLTPTIE